MNRNFLPRDVKRLTERHTVLIRGLDSIQTQMDDLQSAIVEGAHAMANDQVAEILKEIDVEEINRDKKGIRVKALRDYGYTNIAQLAGASVYNLAQIKGISEDGAYTIKNEVNSLVGQAARGIKIRLSTDHKTKSSTQAVWNIYKYYHLQTLISSAEKLIQYYDQQTGYDLEDVQPAKANGLVWLFTPKAKQQRAIEAYDRLVSDITGSYGQGASDVLDAAENFTSVDEHTAWEDFAKSPIVYINVLESLTPDLLGSDDTRYGLPDELAQQIQNECFFPDGLKCQLRPYQEWGVKYILHQGRVLLGDEMGLGKTVEAIAAMVSLKNTGATHFMVVCPASVITNWCREITQHSMLNVVRVHGAGRSGAFQSWIRSGGVAVTTYETTGSLDIADDFRFTLLTVDEAHYIKHKEAQRSQNVRKISTHAERLLFMTGTALENNVDEMVSLMEVLQPDVAARVRGMEALSSAPEFRKRIAPVYYRRKREDVLTELPDKIESREWCTLNAEETQKYEQAVLSKNYADARRVSWNVDDLKNSSKAKRLQEIVSEAEDDGRKVIVFSFFLDTIRKVKELLGSQCTNPINGSVSPQRRQEIIDDFDNAPAGTVLAAQIQSGGTGLNIQSASVVVICEPQFKPSIENQAISRAYRMGQTRDVLVYRLLCEDTIEEKMSRVLDEKQQIFDAFADKSEAAEKSLDLDDATFGKLIQEEIDRINEARGAVKSEQKPNSEPDSL